MSEEAAAPIAAPSEPAAAVEVPTIEVDAADAAPAEGQAAPGGSAAPSDSTPAEYRDPGADIKDYIMKGLSEIEGNAGGTADAKPKEPDATAGQPDEKKTTPEAAEEPKKAKEKETEEHPESVKDTDNAKPEEKEDAEDEPDEAKAEKDKALVKVIPDVDFKEHDKIPNYDRVPKEARAAIEKYAEAGTAMKKTLSALGGDAYIAPLTKIAGGMQDGDNLPIFSGVLEAVGVDDFAGFVDDTLRFAMIEATGADRPKSDAGAHLQGKLKASTNRVIEALFGDDVNVDYVKKLVKYDKGGHLNTADVDKYFEENGELAEPNPVLTELQTENQRLKDELEATKGKTADDQTAAQTRQINDFDKNLSKHTHSSLNDLVIKKSALKAVATDTPELAAGKETMRKLIQTDFDTSIRNNTLYKKLQDSHLKGEVTTANYQTRLTKIVDTAIMQARENAGPLEALVALLYGNGHNAKILDREKDLGAGESDKPGEPTITAEGKKPKAMTMEEYRKYMTEQIAATER